MVVAVVKVEIHVCIYICIGFIYWLVVGGLEHEFYFPFHIWVVILPIDFHIFQDGYCTTNQIKHVGDIWWLQCLLFLEQAMVAYVFPRPTSVGRGNPLSMDWFKGKFTGKPHM